MILVASTRDWSTRKIADMIRQAGDDVLVVSADRSFGNIRLGMLFVPFRALSLLVKRTYYESPAIVLENRLFDAVVATLIFVLRPQACVLWAGMSSLSLWTCQRLGIGAALYMGEEHPEPSRRKGIHKMWRYWIRELDTEIARARRVITESTFVRESIPTAFRSKGRVTYSIVSDLFTSAGATRRPQVDGPRRLGMISTYPKKNARFAVDVARRLADDMEIEFHVFGDPHYFENNPETLPFVVVRYAHLPQGELIENMKAIDVFLFPTRSDGGPRALVEACLLGCDVISSPNCIAPDIRKYFPNLNVISLDVDKWVEGTRGLLGTTPMISANAGARSLAPSFTEDVRQRLLAVVSEIK